MARYQRRTQPFICWLGVIYPLFLFGQVAQGDFVIGTPMNCGPAVNTAHGESGASVSLDGLT
jgi:hypothetical protein